ncbi:MAG: putative prohead protease [Prokaryotic dsDNA virus sp.]|nr:MAG: putative prohead protease [Prokaryotic dsDNA virus sp.]
MSDKKEYKGKDLLSFNEETGQVKAVFSVFNEVDSDNDVVLPKSIRSGYGDKGVVMVWGHDWKNIIGKGKIVQDEEKAIFEGNFNMKTEAGREAYETVKAMEDLQQWSFGFEVHDSENGMFTKSNGDQQEVRFLKDVKVWEVSPVLVGANQNTHTVAIKENKPQDQEEKNQDQEKEKGMSFVAEVDNLLIKMTQLLERCKELTALRLSKEKNLSDTSADSIEKLKDALEDMHQDLDTMLRVATDRNEVIDSELEVNDLFRETSRLLDDSSDLI